MTCYAVQSRGARSYQRYVMLISGVYWHCIHWKLWDVMRWSTLQSFLARSKNPYIWHHYYVHLDKWDLMRWLISQSRAQNLELFVCCMKSLHVITNFVQWYIERKHSANLPIFLRYSCLPNLCFRMFSLSFTVLKSLQHQTNRSLSRNSLPYLLLLPLLQYRI